MKEKVKILTMFFVALVIASTATGEIIYVDADATGAYDGSSWADAYNELQDALVVAKSGDEIRVAQGVYKPGYAPPPPPPPTGASPRPQPAPSLVYREVTFRLINGLVIKGGYAGFDEADPNARDIEVYETILSGDLQANDGPDFANNAENSYNVVTSSGTNETAVLDGFTITAGNANSSMLYHYDSGGGMYIDSGSPTVTNCTFSGNSAFDGGGMYIDSGNPTVTNCTFSGNSADLGGGMNDRRGSPKVTDCTFTRNSARYGGGMASDSRVPRMTNCTFSDNSAEKEGGAIYSRRNTLRLTNCLFTGNSSSYGAGIYSWLSNPILTNCTFIGNSADKSGGGMYNSVTHTSMTNCVLTGNSAAFNGGGIINTQSTSVLINCTLIGNSAGRCGGGIYHGIYFPPPPPSVLEAQPPLKITITSCILWDNSNSEICGIPVDATFSDIKGGWPGQGNIDTEPLFVLPGYWDANGLWIGGDYHLLPGSPCIDTGDPNYVPEPNETDLDGRPRVMGGRIDMGAYESMPSIPAEARIIPRTINLAGKGSWLTCYIWLPEQYNIADIDTNSVLLQHHMKSEQLLVDEHKQVIIARFNRDRLWRIINTGEVEMTITGRLNDGNVFEALDVIRVIDQGGGKPDKHVQASNPSPADGATIVSITTDLSWTPGSGVTSHDVYFGTSSPLPFVCNQVATTFDPGTMDYDVTYYWRIDEVSQWGTTIGRLWNFTTGSLPGPAGNPNPTDGEKWVTPDANLSWTAGSYATSHDVYFGTSSTPPFITNQTYTAFEPGRMQPGTTYYWRIDEVNKWGKTTGQLWSFWILLPFP